MLVVRNQIIEVNNMNILIIGSGNQETIMFFQREIQISAKFIILEFLILDFKFCKMFHLNLSE